MSGPLKNEGHELFAQHLAKGEDQIVAWRKAGYKGGPAVCCRVAARPDVQARVAEIQGRAAARAGATIEKIVARWWEVATADPNDLIQFRRTCCRYCHGVDHGYQWRDAEEFAEALAAASKAGADLPSVAGGHGFNPTNDPAEDCPRCYGEGVGSVHAEDTRKLPEAARALYAGVKVTRDGFEVKMQDQAKALENIARHLGMFNDKLQITGKDGGPIESITTTLTAKEAAERYRDEIG